MKKRRILLLVNLVASAILLAAVQVPWPENMAAAAPARDGDGIEEVEGLFTGPARISQPTSPEADRYKPDIAYNTKHKEYLVVWHNTWPDGHRDIYARRVTEKGDLRSWFAVSTGSHNRLQPAVVYNSQRNEYLVVWMWNASGDGQTYEIWGRKVSYDGSSMGPEFHIHSWPGRTLWSPRVAYNSLNDLYMVVWNGNNAATLAPTDVSFAVLYSTGAVHYKAIISADQTPHHADVAYNLQQQEFLVVWRRMWSISDGDIMAMRIKGNGQMILPYFSVDTSGEDQMSPSVASNDKDRYVVVWQHTMPGPCCDWNIRGLLLNPTGGAVGSSFTVAGSYDDETNPRVSAVKGPRHRFLAVWQRSTSQGDAVWANAWGDPGFWHYGPVTSGIAWHSQNPAVAMGSKSAYVVYEGDLASNPMVFRHIYGQKWIPNVVFLPVILRNW